MPPMTKAKSLLKRIAADVEKKRVRPAELARAAGISLTSLLTMLDPEWENRAVSNLEAIEAAYAKGKAKAAKRG